MLSVGRTGALQLIADQANFSQLNFPAEMTGRGFPADESDGLRGFHYRSDGYAVWAALHRYTSAVVWRTYSSDRAVGEDLDLQQWAASLASRRAGGVPGFPSHLSSRHQLADTLTAIIFSASAGHHALNAPHHTYSYPPVRPTLLTKWMPSGTKDLSWAWIKSALPDLGLASEIYGLANLLAKPPLCRLARLDPAVAEWRDITARLHRDLAAVTRQVRARRGEYDYLDPENIGCSIDI